MSLPPRPNNPSPSPPPTSLVSRSLRVASNLLSLVSTPSITINIANLPAGTYFVTRSSPQGSSTQKLTID